MGLLTEQLKNYQESGNPNPVEVEDVKLGGSPATVEAAGEPQKPLRNPTGLGPLGNMTVFGGSVRNDFTPESYVREAAEAGWGESRYDKMTGYMPGEDIEDVRAKAQPWYWKIGNGVAKGGVTAATTAVNTVAGTVFGVGSSLFEMASEVANGGEVDMKKVLDAGVNNFLSEQLIKFQNFSEELFPNYKTAEERTDEYQKEWYKHLGTANFIGDSFLKNFGFTVGAMAGGAVWARLIGAGMAKGLASNIMKGAVVGAEGDAEALAALKNIATAVENGTISTIDATKLAGNLADVVKKINRMEARLQLYGSVIGAMGEGTTEGLMAKDEFLKEYMPQLERMYQAKSDNIEKDVLKSNPFLRYYIETGEVDEEGNPIRILTQRGRDEVNRRKDDLVREYMDAQAFANDQGNRLASTTFLLNLPILTASNTIQFGRMFSKGWQTARKQALVDGTASIAELAGKDAKLALNAAYKSTGSVAGRTVLNSLKVAGSESFEEMAQGVISAGTKNVAATNIAAFNNDAYDPDSVGDFGDWFAQMQEGGAEYLSDSKNWQEGFLGAVTGLLGIPSRSIHTWNGGVIGAYNEASGRQAASDLAAEKLNTLVNSQEFQDRWHGYIRHLKYDKDMQKAASKNNPYDWHNANDKQLINDIITFDNAGKLDDLFQIVDAYSGVTLNDAKNLLPALGNENGKMTPEEVVDAVKTRASDLKDAINEYKQIYDAISSRVKPGTSKAFFEETLFTMNQIRLAEKRFLEMFNETLGVIDKSIGKKADTEQLKSIHDSLAKYFTGNIVPEKFTAEEARQVEEAVNTMESLVKGKKAAEQKIADMKKLSADRAALYRKLVTLEGATQEEFEKQAINPQQVAETARKEQIRREADVYQNVEQVKVAYRSLPKDRSMDKEFFDVLVEMEDKNPSVKSFLELNAAYQDFLDSYQNSEFRISDDHIAASDAQRRILSDIYDSIESRQDLLDTNMDDYLSEDPNNPTQKEQDIKMQLRSSIPDGFVDVAYRNAVDAIRNGLKEYNDKLTFVGNRTQQQKKQKPTGLRESIPGQTGKGPSKPPSLRQAAGVKQQSAQPNKTVKDKLGREWSVGQTVYMYKLDDEGELVPVLLGEYKIEGFYAKSTKNNAPQARLVSNDGKRILVDMTLDNILRVQPEKMEQLEPVKNAESFPVVNPESSGVQEEAVNSAAREDLTPEARKEANPAAELNGNEKLHYLRTGMPENESFAVKRAREIAQNESLDLKEKKRQLAEVDLRDFSLVKPEYDETWNAVQNFKGQNGFENVANILERDDQVEFRINDDFPKLSIDGQPEETQILMYTRKNGKEYFLNTLVRSTSKYDGLQGLREAIFEKYNEWRENGGTGEFIFKDDSGKPITTTVWSKRNGIVIYNQNDKSDKYKNERPIKDISGYDKDAPIVFIGRDKVHILNNKKVDASALSGLDENYGALYYLAKGNNGQYIVPIRLGVEHFNHDTRQFTNPAFEAINSAFKGIADYVKSVSDQNISAFEDRSEVRTGLSPYLKDLSKALDIHEDIFTLYADRRTGRMKLAIYDAASDRRNPSRIDAEKITPEWLANAMAARNRSINFGSDTNVESLVEQGMITSNAVAMRPKNVDFYTYPWNETSGKFEPYGVQKEIAEQPKPEESVLQSNAPKKEDIQKEVKEKRTRKSAAPTEKREKKIVETPQQTNAPVAPVQASIEWAGLTDDQRSGLEAQGYDEETWNSISEDARKNELDCIGV